VCKAISHGELRQNAFNQEKINKLSFGTIVQKHVLSHQKPHVLDVGLPSKTAVKICHLVTKSINWKN